MHGLWIRLTLFASFCSSLLLLGSNSEEFPQAMTAQLSIYRDLRGFNTLNIMVSKSKVPGSFGIWGFTDFHSSPNSNNAHSFERSFSEYRLFNTYIGEKIGLPNFALEAEFNNSTPSNQHLFRFGLTYKFLHPFGWVKLRGYPLSFSKNGKQIGIIYFLNYSIISFIGFVDVNFITETGPKVVTENEISFKIYDPFSIIAEHRYSQFEDESKDLKGHSLAIGVKVK